MVFQTFLTQLPQLNWLSPSAPHPFLFQDSFSQKMAWQSAQFLRPESRKTSHNPTLIKAPYTLILLLKFISNHCSPFHPQFGPLSSLLLCRKYSTYLAPHFQLSILHPTGHRNLFRMYIKLFLALLESLSVIYKVLHDTASTHFVA